MTRGLPLLKKALVLFIPFAAAALAWAIIAAPLLAYRTALGIELESKQDVLQHYQALIAGKDQLAADLAQLKRDAALSEVFYNAPNANAGAALLQQKLAALVAAQRGQVRMSRIEAKAKPQGFESFAVTLTFGISTVGLSKILVQLEAQKPVIIVDSLAIRAGPALARLTQAASAPAQELTAEEPVLEVSLTASAFLHAKG